MEFSREEVLQVVIDALKEAQRDISDDAVLISEKTRPIGELKAFDSLTSVMVTSHCFDSLKYDGPLEITTLFMDKSGNALTVSEVVDKILKLLKNK
jgi:hypothetical protein